MVFARLDESQEEIAKLQSQLRKAKDDKQAKASDLSKAQRRVAELEAAGAGSESPDGTAETPTASTPAKGRGTWMAGQGAKLLCFADSMG